MIERYLRIRKEHDNKENKVKETRFKKLAMMKDLDKTENFLKSVQSSGMFIGEILNAQSDEKYLVKISSG